MKQRLAAQQLAGEAEHPSADTLAAFAEQGLRVAERQRVLSHLALCSECRQALALAASVDQLHPAAVPARSHVARFPSALRWASVAAALAVAIGIGVLSYEHQNRPQLAASAAPQVRENATPSVAQPAAQANSEPAMRQALATKSRSADSEPRVIAHNAGRKVSPALKKAEGGAVLGGIIASSRVKPAFRTPTVADGFMASNVPPPPPPPPIESANGTVSTFSDASAAPAAIAPSAASEQVSIEAKSNVQVAEAGSASKVTRQEFKTPARASLQQQPVSLAAMKAVATSAIAGGVGGAIHGLNPIAHWTISSAGKLQRRTGDGRFTSIEPAPGVSIRAVAAQGIEVWAAGSQADLSAKEWQQRPVLFHSSDAGETWMKIEGPWQSPITTLSLSGTNILTVVSTDGSWTTADAGRNWTKK